jgi:predicted AAA+ superfamily ATPase
MVERLLGAVGALLIRGPKGCGKTETGRQHSQSEIDIDNSPRIKTAMAVDPRLLLEGETPRLLDEWQQQPDLWNTTRREVDRRQAKGQFILTGSSTPRDFPSGQRHSGVGRFGILDMRTMSWSERGWSTGGVTLQSLLGGEPPQPLESEPGLPEIARRLAIGGWPGTLDLPDDAIWVSNNSLLDMLVEEDAARSGGVKRDPIKLRRALQSLARNVSTECSLATLAQDAGGADGRLADETISDYVQTFHALMIQEDLPAWNTHIRSSAQLRQRPKRHLADPSLACAALGLGPGKLAADLEYTGLLFESAVIHDLRVHAAALGGQVFHYRDSNGLEADAVVELRDGTWGAFEVKLGFGATDEAAASLLRFAANVDQTRMGPPATLTVITGSGIAHRRPDGVSVVPLGCLG